MRIEQWVIVVGMFCGLILITVAMIPDDVWDRDVTNATPAFTDIQGTRAGIISPSPGIQDISPGAKNFRHPGSPSWGRNVALKGLTPFTKARSQRFQGRVDMVFVRGADVDWGQVHIWVAGGLASRQQISLAPDWYLKYLGCPIAENMYVKGVAFDFESVQPGDKLYAKTITVNGNACRLRNDEGFALWSNRLR